MASWPINQPINALALAGTRFRSMRELREDRDLITLRESKRPSYSSFELQNRACVVGNIARLLSNTVTCCVWWLII